MESGVPELPSGATYWRPSSADEPICQCELISDLDHITLDPGGIGGENLELIRTVHSWVVVMSQDCDLEWDRTARRRLASARPKPSVGQAAVDWGVADRDNRKQLMEGILFCVADEVEAVHAASG